MATVLIANTDFFKKPPGLLKIGELVFGMITMSLCANYSTYGKGNILSQSECFLLITSCTYFIGTLLIILSSVFSLNTETRLRQTLFEPLYHLLAFIFYFSGSVAVLAGTNYHDRARRDAFMAAGGLGVITSLMYGVSAYDSYRGYVTE